MVHNRKQENMSLRGTRVKSSNVDGNSQNALRRASASIVPDTEVVHGGTVDTAGRYVENDGRLLTSQANILSFELELLYASCRHVLWSCSHLPV